MLRRDRVILTSAAVITAGAIISRSHARAGLFICIAGLIFLLLPGIRKTVSGVARYRKLPPLSRAWVALQAIVLIIIVNSFISGRLHYFPVLLVLAAEYFIYDSQTRR